MVADAIEAISAEPCEDESSSEKPNKWIPVSERLPDLPQGEDEVLITLEDEDGDRDVYKGFYEDGLWWTQMYCGCNKISIANPRSRVVAWMPLPEPYKADVKPQESEDGMTNGEKFKEVFRISQVDEGELCVFVWLPNHDAIEISIDWWNAPYKAESEDSDD